MSLRNLLRGRGVAAEVDEVDAEMIDDGQDYPGLPNGELADLPSGRRRRILGPAVSGFVSMILHAALMLSLGLFTIRARPDSGDFFLVSGKIGRPEEFLTQELDELVAPALNLGVADVFSAAGPVAPEIEQFSIEPARFEPADPAFALADTSFPDPRMDLLGDAPFGFGGDARAVVAGSQQAVDRITEELTRILFKRNALLVWCFDQSNSIKPDRDDIRRRVRRIYAELAATPFAQGDAVLTEVTSFGKDFMVHTERPTSDFDKIEAAIDAVPVDESGVEMICQAVNRAIEAHRRYATERLEMDRADETAPETNGDGPVLLARRDVVTSQRQLVLILVTDESGDRGENAAYLERTLEAAKRARCRIYVMGREASFAHPHFQVRWTDPEANVSWTIPIDRGPETAFFEVLQFDGFRARSDVYQSGFGPYDLVRLAKETGGTYFLLPNKGLSEEETERRESRMNQMQSYVPETVSRAEYIGARSISPLRQTVWQIVSDFDAWDDGWLRQISLPWSLPADRERLIRVANGGAATAKKLVRDYHSAALSLERVEQFRQDEPRRRWQANYDLLLAQLIAYRARTSEYLACLESAAKNPPSPKEPPGPDKEFASWSIRSTKEICSGEKTKADVERATKLLEEVINNHPDTPWALRAGWELKRPFGYQLVEVYRSLPKKVAAEPSPSKPPPPKPKPRPTRPNL